MEERGNTLPALIRIDSKPVLSSALAVNSGNFAKDIFLRS